MRMTEALINYDYLKKMLPGQDELWLQQLRNLAADDIKNFGLPTIKTEAWKYTRLNALLQQDFSTATAVAAATSFNIADYIVTEGVVLVFIDGHYYPALSTVQDANVLSSNFVTSLSLHKDLLQQHVGHYASTKLPGFVALNTALMQEGAVLHVAAGAQISAPIQLLFIQSGQQPLAVHMRNLIVLENLSTASVIETYVSLAKDAVYFTNAVTEIVLKEDAQLQYYKQQQESLAGFHIHHVSVQQARNSHLKTYNFDLGGKLVRNWLQANLAGENAQSHFWGLYAGHGQQHIDNHTRVEHQVAHTTSREYYKGALFDKSRAVFNGQVFIALQAQKSDAEQRNRNWLLSAEAEINTKPELEIYADDVKCAHGATISDLDPEAIFYLCSRGLSAAEAQNILLAGFMSEIVQQVPVLKLREKLQELIQLSLQPNNQFKKW